MCVERHFRLCDEAAANQLTAKLTREAKATAKSHGYKLRDICRWIEQYYLLANDLFEANFILKNSWIEKYYLFAFYIKFTLKSEGNQNWALD